MYITIIQSINDGLLFSLFLVHMVGQHNEVVDKLSQENLFIRIVQFILLFIVAYLKNVFHIILILAHIYISVTT